VYDAYIWSASPNYTGNWSTLYTGIVGSGRKRSLFRFEPVDPIPAGSTIEWASFSVFMKGRSSASTVNLHRITEPWAENSVTWNNFGPGDGDGYDSTVLGSFEPGAVGWYTLDVTALVQDWVNGVYPDYGESAGQRRPRAVPQQ